MLKIASSAHTVLRNIEHFPREVAESNELQGRLAYARSWYAHKSAAGTWIISPSKYIGYVTEDDCPVPAQGYITTSEELNGRRTEAQLRQWFTVVDAGTALYKELSAALFAFLAKYGKTPSTAIRFNVLKEVLHEHLSADKQDDQNDTIVELMVAVAKSLPVAQFERLQARLSR